ncbi:MAG TPA: anthranilate phosphoribosyltransferase [Halanaerobiaceae bacterium]|jgi:anthranilate phosphoribosyltransferase|nr:anthranilate phosphoribosyltransferase [Bacillota bacterium]HHU92731.1 anthranilate phosphoribosyltransferase [Halanaerobiaceae bacterium]HOA39812.1 anthranilate phosphoribosyltransferase [Halanaerobiales bacterium]HPZ62600.1 anthranilate phosphoribosyltransferase [Halanaerobiales bacterium]HQD03869.1 anthranilate phosphoribosyltransferase [Halanaerobiales bacterium]
MFINYLEKVVARENLSLGEMEKAMEIIMEGGATDSQLAGFLVGLSMKGETIEEITAAARVMRNKAISIKSDRVLIDSCGTGGDCKGTFNISTTVALLMAAAGLSVAKHGNRSVSSKSGSADLLEALGININLSPQQVEYCLNEIGFAFLFAPYFHKAMKYAARPRRELGLRTIFNILGPLTNPAGTRYQILGVYQPDLVYPMAAVLKNLGIDSAMVVHGAGGIDEFSLAGENKVAYLRNGQIEEFYISPEEVGLQRADLKELIGGTAEKNREITLAILKGERGAKRDVVLFNAAAAFLVSGLVDSWAQGIELAAEMIDSGRTLKKLEEMIEFTNSLEVVL